MRIIIAGSRTVSEEDVRDALDWCPWIGFASCVVSGGAKGADRFGARWAEESGLEVRLYPADWEKFGKRAGPLRNKEMSENADGLVAVWDGSSRGTANMIELGRNAGLRVFIVRTDLNGVKDVPASGPIASRWEDAEERAGMMEFSGGVPRSEAERMAGREIGSSAP